MTSLQIDSPQSGGHPGNEHAYGDTRPTLLIQMFKTLMALDLMFNEVKIAFAQSFQIVEECSKMSSPSVSSQLPFIVYISLPHHSSPLCPCLRLSFILFVLFYILFSLRTSTAPRSLKPGKAECA